MSFILMFHFTSAAYFMYGISFYSFGLNPPNGFLDWSSVGFGPFRYFCFWNQIIVSVFFILSFINDIGGLNLAIYNDPTTLKEFIDVMFCSLVFPSSWFSVLIYWGLFYYDRELIVSRRAEAWFPRWLNHNLHTLPVFAVLTELYLIPHTFPTRRTGLSILGFYCLAYDLWVLLIALKDNYLVYRFQRRLTVVGQLLLIPSMLECVVLLYCLGEVLDSVMWGTLLDSITIF